MRLLVPPVLWLISQAAEPLVHTGYYPALNATNPPVAKCAEGILNVIIEAVGLDQTLKPNSNNESPATIQLRQQIQNELPSIVSIFDAVRDKLMEDIDQSMNHTHLNYTGISKEAANALYTGLATAGLGSVKGLLPESLEKALAPLILYLISPTWNTFLGGVLGNATGAYSEVYYPAIIRAPNTPEGGFRSRGNLLISYANAVNYAMAHDVDTSRRLCSLQNAIVAILACGMPDGTFDKSKTCENKLSSVLASTCTYKDSDGVDQTINIDDKYVVNPFFEIDLRDKNNGELPMEIDTITPEEHVKLYFLWFAIMGASQYTSTTFACGRIQPDYDILPGWTLTDVVSYYQPGSDFQMQKVRSDCPFSLIMRPTTPDDTNKCSAVILIRGTTNAFEWGIDTDIAALPGFGTPGSNVHGGFAKVVASNYPHIQEVLYNISETEGCDSLKVMVAGHSLGAAASHILGYWLALHYPHYDVQVASFAAPSAFEEPDLAVFRKLVNARRIWVSSDPVSKAPLAIDETPYGFPGCHFINKVRTGSLGLFAPYPAAYKIDITKLYDGVRTAPFRDDWFGLNLKLFTPMPKIFPAGWNIDLTKDKINYLLLENTPENKQKVEGLLESIDQGIDTANNMKLLIKEVKALKPSWGIISPDDTKSRTLCIALKIGLPIPINVTLGHVQAYQCWASFGCQASGVVKDCTVGMSPPLVMAICLS